MPQLGEIQRAKDIGSNRLNQSQQYIWVDCMDCGKERWVQLVKMASERTATAIVSEARC